jgi:hypothetical protein
MNEEQFTGYIPEMWIMRKDDIYAAQTALRIGIKYIEEAMDLMQNKDFYMNQHIRDECLKIMQNEKILCEQALEGLNKPE